MLRKISILKKKIDKILEVKNLSYYELCKLVDFHESSFSMILSGKRAFPEKILNKILPILEVSEEEFESWILSDKYPKETLGLAIKARKEFPYKRKSVLTVNIDKILYEKYMSRTALAKKINYSQSGLNRMIIGEINMSKSVMERIAAVFEISPDEILSWIIADKYSLTVLEKAYSSLAD